MSANYPTPKELEVSAEELPLHCPRPGQQTWNSHPRVFLDVARKGQVRCPYCGTLYTLKGGAIHHPH